MEILNKICSEFGLCWILIGSGVFLLLLNSSDSFQNNSLVQFYGLLYTILCFGFLFWKMLKGIELTLFDLLLLGFSLNFGFSSTLGISKFAFSGFEAELGIYAILLTVTGLFFSYLGFQFCRKKAIVIFPTSSKSVCDFLKRVDQINSGPALMVFFLRVGLLVFEIYNGVVFAGTAGVTSTVGVGTSALFIISSTMMPVGVVFGMSLYNHPDPKLRWMARGFLFLELASGFLHGRRQVLFFLIVSGFVAYMRVRHVRVLHVISIMVAAVVIVGFVWPFFLHTRRVMVEHGVHAAPVEDRVGLMVEEVFPASWETYEFWDELLPSSSYYQDLTTRPFLLLPLVETIDDTRNGYEFMNGRIILQAVISVIPRFLWSGKTEYIESEGFHTEEMIQLHFGKSPEDLPSTLVWNAYAEAGFLGVAVYMLVFGMLIGFLHHEIIRSKNLIIGIMIFGICLKWVLLPERGIEFVLGDLRIILFLLVLQNIMNPVIQFFGKKKLQPAL